MTNNESRLARLRAKAASRGSGTAEINESARQKQRSLLIQDFNATYNTPAGKRVLRHIMRICGFQKPSTVVNPQTGEIGFNSTVYNESRRSVYLEIRDLVKPSILRDVEMDYDEF